MCVHVYVCACVHYTCTYVCVCVACIHVFPPQNLIFIHMSTLLPQAIDRILMYYNSCMLEYVLYFNRVVCVHCEKVNCCFNKKKWLPHLHD